MKPCRQRLEHMPTAKKKIPLWMELLFDHWAGVTVMPQDGIQISEASVTRFLSVQVIHKSLFGLEKWSGRSDPSNRLSKSTSSSYLINFRLYFCYCSHGKQTLNPFYVISARCRVSVSIASIETIIYNCFYTFITTQEVNQYSWFHFVLLFGQISYEHLWVI